MTHEVNWKIINLQRKSIPQTVLEDSNRVNVLKSHVMVKDIEVFYREGVIPMNVKSSGKNVLLLHGKSYTSETWENLGTLHLLAALGHRAAAIDLPGYGQTRQKLSGGKGEFILVLISVMHMIKRPPVIVSPSMSGGYSCAFLKMYPNCLSGYVPIAPVATKMLSHDLLKKIYVPTLLIYGSEDTTGLAEASLKVLKALPNSQVIKFYEAKHSAYLSKPELFHKVLFNFLFYIK